MEMSLKFLPSILSHIAQIFIKGNVTIPRISLEKFNLTEKYHLYRIVERHYHRPIS